MVCVMCLGVACRLDVCHVLPAGAGKTTLMDVLACRKTAGRMEGEVRVSDAHW
jgi:ABC-type uncharacterized transport system ATPase subunit